MAVEAQGADGTGLESVEGEFVVGRPATGDERVALGAVTGTQIEFKDLVPVAFNQQRRAVGTVGIFPMTNATGTIAGLRKHPATAHLPIIAFAAHLTPAQSESAQRAGATLVADTSGIQAQLPQLLEAALRVE